MQVIDINGKVYSGRTGLSRIEIELDSAKKLRYVINNMSNCVFSRSTLNGFKYYAITKLYKTRHSKITVDLCEVDYKTLCRERQLEKLFNEK